MLSVTNNSTDSIMKNLINLSAIGFVLLAAGSTTTSCIFGGIDGEFVYKTTWESDGAPFAPLSPTDLTIDFNCNCIVTIFTGQNSMQYFGIYDCNVSNAYFQTMTIPVDDTSVTLIDGIRDGSKLTLHWRLDSDMSLHTSSLNIVTQYN